MFLSIHTSHKTVRRWHGLRMWWMGRYFPIYMPYTRHSVRYAQVYSTENASQRSWHLILIVQSWLKSVVSGFAHACGCRIRVSREIGVLSFGKSDLFYLYNGIILASGVSCKNNVFSTKIWYLWNNKVDKKRENSEQPEVSYLQINLAFYVL